MALTKVTGQVINDSTGLVVGVTTVGGGLSATDGFFSGIVTAVGDASFSGNVSVGGTLTYEDVTNIDAVGLVTARNGIVVGSGITLSKDGDVFFTGIITGNGSGLTNLATDLVNDTTPQLGGNLDTNDKNIVFADSDGGSGTDNRAVFGASSDLQIYHDGGGSKITHANTGDLIINNTSGDTWIGSDGVVRISNTSNNGYMAKFDEDGAVELYHDGTKKIETSSSGVTVTGTVAATAVTGDGSSLTGITTGPYGNYQFSTWYTTSNFTPGAENVTIENWAETNAPGYSRLGTAPSYSSGVFTFPSTGYWRIQANIIYYHTSSNGDTLTFSIRHSTDSGSSFNNVAATGARLDGSGPSNAKHCWSVTATIKCDDVSTNRFDIRGSGFHSSVGVVMGGSNANNSTNAGCNMHIEKMANL